MESTCKKKLSLIYHYPCYDGCFAAINIFLFYQNFKKDKYEITFNPIRTAFNKIKAMTGYDKVIMADVGIEDSEIDFICSNKNFKLTIFEHHESTIKKYKVFSEDLAKNDRKIKVFFDEKNHQSACGLTFRYYRTKSLQIDKELADKVYNDNYYKINIYVEESDTGSEMLDKVNEFKNGLCRQVYPMYSLCDFSTGNINKKLSRFLDLDFTFTCRTGEKAYRAFKTKSVNELLHRQIYLFDLKNGIKFFGLFTKNKQYRNHGCIILAKISKNHGNSPIGAFCYLVAKDTYKISMRCSEPKTTNLSEIAVAFGGGGHSGAASFVKTNEEINKLIVKKVNIYQEIINISKHN